MEAPAPAADAASASSAGDAPPAASSTSQLGASDADLDEIARRVRETQEESERLDALQRQVAEQMGSGGVDGSAQNSQDVDSRSVFVGNVDYQTVPTELEDHFKSCGAINRVTILCDRFSGAPKGYAYVEFADASSVDRALALNESQFRGRPLKVTAKRTNVPGLGRGRGFGGYPMRGRGFAPRRFSPYFRPRGRRPWGP